MNSWVSGYIKFCLNNFRNASAIEINKIIGIIILNVKNISIIYWLEQIEKLAICNQFVPKYEFWIGTYLLFKYTNIVTITYVSWWTNSKCFLNYCKYFAKAWLILVIQDFAVVFLFQFFDNTYYYTVSIKKK